MTTLTTERLILRPFQLDDTADLFAVFSNADAMRYWADVHASVEETRRFVEATIRAPARTTCDFVIELNGKAVGKAGMWQAPEIGFILHPDHHRRGYMKEALGAVIPHLFRAYHMPALTADVDPDNRASLALLEGLGFRRTGSAKGTIEIEGRMCDSVYLALDRPASP